MVHSLTRTTAAASVAVDIYNNAKGTWFTTQLSAPRLQLSAATIGKMAIFAGGQILSGLLL
jgi:hypothetical protein